jgi:hypothetical protein
MHTTLSSDMKSIQETEGKWCNSKWPVSESRAENFTFRANDMKFCHRG